VFDPDEVLPTLTPTITPTPTPEGCFTSTDSFQSAPFQTQTGVFTAEFDVSMPEVNCNMLSALVGLSQYAAPTHVCLGPIVGFGGALGAHCEIPYRVQARDGDVYRADSEVPATYGQDIHIRMVVDVPAHTYSVHVSAPGKAEITIATDYAFRTEQSGVTSLGYWNLWSGTGWIDACAFEVTS
jgi:unsaturated chondroitin disaccharide hydrolase